MINQYSTNIGGTDLIIEHGRMAKLADGSVTVQYGGTIVLVTAQSAGAREGIDFFPLTVDYREKSYAAGRIPGNFFRREGRPTEKETLTCRIIDRHLRPMFPKGYKGDTQVLVTVLSADPENNPDVLAMVGASAALCISTIPFNGPIGSVRVGRVDGQLIANPTYPELEESDIDLVVAGREEGVIMVEAGANEVSEEDMLAAIEFGHQSMQSVIQIQKEMVDQLRKEKQEFAPPATDEQIAGRINQLAADRLNEALKVTEKQARQDTTNSLRDEVVSTLAEEFPEREEEILAAFKGLEKETLRRMILKEGLRVDGRGLKDIRPITVEVGLLPRAHGSALFTRGETQAIVATTLGTRRDEQRMDELLGESFKRFILHYNFPPFSVGEVRPIRGPGRREIGHGALAERALKRILPEEEAFPYTIRTVSEILESNGSSSMATVCGGSLSMLDAGVPIAAPVAGIAMGLIVEDGESAILSDILGMEDHLGDMDFKVAGTEKGITALQMDIKVTGVTHDLMSQAMQQAKEGRQFVLEKMIAALPSPKELAEHAPRIYKMHIHPDRIRDIIGPGGKVVRKIQADCDCVIDIEDDGVITLASASEEGAEKAREMIEYLTAMPDVGKIYDGKVVKIVKFGAFVQFMPGVDGLVHISAIADRRIDKVEDVLKEGDDVKVKLMEIDSQGRMNLSMKDVDDESKKQEKDSEPA